MHIDSRSSTLIRYCTTRNYTIYQYWMDANRTARKSIYSQASNISRTKYPNLNIYRVLCQLTLCNPMEQVGAAPTTLGWSTILLPTKIRLISEFWWCVPHIIVTLDTSNPHTWNAACLPDSLQGIRHLSDPSIDVIKHRTVCGPISIFTESPIEIYSTPNKAIILYNLHNRFNSRID